MHKSKEITREEARYLLMKHLTNLVSYWEGVEERNSREKLEGLLHSVLVALDGGAGGLPGYILIPITCDEDKEFSIENNIDYYKQQPENIEQYDIGGALHEELFPYLRKEIKRPENLKDFTSFLAEEQRKINLLMKRKKNVLED